MVRCCVHGMMDILNCLVNDQRHYKWKSLSRQKTAFYMGHCTMWVKEEY